MDFDWIFSEVPAHASHDIATTIVFVAFLLMIDTSLRFLIELVEYNKAIGRPVTAWNMFRALWYGWAIVETPSGERKRFLASKNFRTSFILKAGVQYPLMFTLSGAAFLITDYQIMGYQADAFISSMFMLFPVACEITSIIEKLNELDSSTFIWFHDVVHFLKELKK